MPTTLYLLRHGATAANLAQPPRLLGRRLDPPLAPLGLRQAEAVRDALAAVPLRRVYTSPLLRAAQTAALVAAPHGLTPQPLDALSECDLGRWEGLDWPTIAAREPEAYRRFHERPGQFGYPGGESLADVAARVAPLLDGLLERHAGEAVLVVAHHAVNRVWLAGLLGPVAGSGPPRGAGQWRALPRGPRVRRQPHPHAARRPPPPRPASRRAIAFLPTPLSCSVRLVRPPLYSQVALV